MKYSFSAEVRAAISDRFGAGGRFSRNDLADIAEMHGKNLNAVTHILRRMSQAGKIKQVDSVQVISSSYFRLQIFEVVTDDFCSVSAQVASLRLQNIITGWGVRSL